MPPLPKQDPRLDAFRDAAMEFDAVYGLLAKSCGLSDPEYWSLVLIKEGIVTQKEISDQLCLNRQTLNSAFKLLIKKGLIRLEPFQDNQRSKRAILTETGQHFVDETVSKMERMEAQAWETLTPEEQESITQLTLRFRAALKRALEEEKTNTHSSEDLSSQ